MSKGIQSTVFFMLVFLLGHTVQAWSQPVILRGKVLPDSATNYAWFHRTTDRKVFQYRDGAWMPAYNGNEAKKVYAVNSIVVIQHHSGYYGTQTEHGVFLSDGHFDIHADSNLLWIRSGYTAFIDTRPRPQPYGLLDFFVSFETKCRDIGNGDTIDGHVYHSVPSYHPNFHGAYTCDEVRFWGLLGPDAEWKIPPIFDAPFQFKNGIAEVIYYGQRRKINWEGEWVE